MPQLLEWLMPVVDASAAPASFFRNPAAWDALGRALLESKKTGRTWRGWAPDCGAGAHAYSLAVLLLEAAGPRWREAPVRVFATEPRPDLLSRARAGRFAPQAAEGLSARRLKRFFLESSDGGLKVRPLLRQACLFMDGQAPALSRLDVIACRGALPGKETLLSYHLALNPGGFLLLEHPALPGAMHGLFDPVDRAGRLQRARVSARAAAAPTQDGGTWKLLFSVVEEAILVRDVRSDAILEANPSASRLFGWSLPALLTMRACDLLAPPGPARRGAPERRGPSRLALPRYRRKDGTTFPAQASNAFLMLRGRPSSLLVINDATAALRAGAEARDTAAFVGDVAHDLRGPLNVIRGYAETLRAGVRGKARRSDFLDSIERQAGRLTGMVERLVDFGTAPRGRVQRSRIPLAKIAQELIACAQPAARKLGLTITQDIPAGLGVLADPYSLPHILGNLLDNAVKFNKQGGKIHLRARARGGEALITLEDTGLGIPEEDLQRVFQRLFRSERTRNTPGTGLGLAIVLRLVEENGGRIWAENSPQGGAIFRLALPLAGAE